MPSYDVAEIKDSAKHHWKNILAALCNLSGDVLDARHHPCPKCGGTDRFRAFNDVDETGGMMCNNCGKFNDGIAAIQWLLGKTFPETLEILAKHLVIKPKRGGRPPQFEEGEWKDIHAQSFVEAKKGIKVESLQVVGAVMGRHQRRQSVIAIPVWPEMFGEGPPCGHILVEIRGRKLPTADGGWTKVKTEVGTKPGIVGRIEPEGPIWKVEGPLDVLALLSIPGLPEDVSVICNAFGCGENPAKNAWLERLADRVVYVVHDQDTPGQLGAMYTPTSDGREKPGWAPCIAAHAAEVRNVQLPYEKTKTHGKDLRDFVVDGGTYERLLEYVEKAEIVGPPRSSIHQSRESSRDPHRLARVNLAQYRRERGQDATLRYWRSEWYTWHRGRGHYRKIDEPTLRAWVTRSIKTEFDRANIVAQETAQPGQDIPETERVTRGLVSDVILATSSELTLSESIEPGTLTGGEEPVHKPNWIHVKNGILDLEKFLVGDRDCLLPHTPDWFNFVARPYEFDSEATCPRWKKTIEENMDGDQDRMDLLQEWAGYCLTISQQYQKFIILEGEGANGKSVYCAGLEAIVGNQNCSFVPLEAFHERFAKTQTNGKLLNICGDVGEVDKLSEGVVKQFSSATPVYYDRKGIDGIEAVPTARLLIATNNRPRFSDKSDGIWRRILYVPFRREVPPEKRVLGMDSTLYWQQSGELPGMLNWAALGLRRLRKRGGFAESANMMQELHEYREEANPTRSFFQEGCRLGDVSIGKTDFYQAYQQWMGKRGYRALSMIPFVKEVHRFFGEKVQEIKRRSGTSRVRVFDGVTLLEGEDQPL